MRISDWSSDVCSSDLRDEPFKQGKPNDILDRGAAGPRPRRLSRRRKNESAPRRRRADAAATGRVRQLSLPAVRAQGLSDRQGDTIRSEERRVGQECVSTCRSRWSPSLKKKKKT